MKTVFFSFALVLAFAASTCLSQNPLVGACCAYPSGKPVDCSETTAKLCVATFDVPKFWTSGTPCGECPKTTPPEALCRCGESCCPFNQGAGETTSMFIAIGVLVGLFLLCCGCCVAFGPLGKRRKKKE
jgi:hypothetical protein